MMVGLVEIVASLLGPVWKDFLLTLKYILDSEVDICNRHLNIVVCESGYCPLHNISKNLDNLYNSVKHLDIIGIIRIVP